MSARRSYRMDGRRASMAATREAILHAVRDIAFEQLEFDPTLAAVAEKAEVSVQTVLRHFTTREELLRSATDAATATILEQRRPAVGDVDGALATLLEHYEQSGDFVLAMLAREGVDAKVARITDLGRREHRAWVTAVFGGSLGDGHPDALVDLLVVATDVYAWKLLRRDRGHPVAVVRTRMRTMTDALIAHGEVPE